MSAWFNASRVVGRATASASDAYPLERVRPASGASVCITPRHEPCEMQFCAHASDPDAHAQNCPRQGRGDSPLALNPSRNHGREAAATITV